MQDHYQYALESVRSEQDRASLSAKDKIIEYVFDFIDDVGGMARHFTYRGLSIVDPAVKNSASTMADRIDTTLQDSARSMVDSTERAWTAARNSTFADAGVENHWESPALAVLLSAATISAIRWRSLLERYAGAAAAEVIALVKAALAARMDPDVLAKKLRKYVAGAENLQDFTKNGEIDLRGIPPHLQGAAKQMVFNAARIAFTEIHNARSIAEAKLFAEDPLVRAVQWTLSPDRGSLVPPDECDLLAYGDFYGLGQGVYPVWKIPGTPHPFDRCERLPVKRSPRDADQPKPNPEMTASPLESTIHFPRGGRISARGAYRARLSAHQAIINYIGR